MMAHKVKWPVVCCNISIFPQMSDQLYKPAPAKAQKGHSNSGERGDDKGENRFVYNK